jgi:hypothetical protein
MMNLMLFDYYEKKTKQLLEAKQAADRIRRMKRERELAKKKRIIMEAKFQESHTTSKERVLVNRRIKEAEQKAKDQRESVEQKMKEERTRRE